MSLTQSIAAWSPTQRRRAAVLSALITLPVAILTALRLGRIFVQADTQHYLALAQGQPAMMPFAARQLGPLLVRAIVHISSLSIHNAFYLEGTLALLVFFATVLWFLLRSAAPRFMIVAIAGLAFWPWQFNALVTPDLLYAALLGLFLILLERRRFLLAALMLLPLTVTRESTLLTLACLLIAGWRRLRLAEAAAAIASTAAGILLVSRLTANALPNSEHIPAPLYLFAKMPWAFVRNFLGLTPWSNVYPYPECTVPRWQIPLHLGRIQAIGICGFHPDRLLRLIFFALASFGLFPLLLLAVRHLRRPVPTAPSRAQILLRFTLLYGLLSFAIAGLLGESFQRLFAYSWPAFLIALPILLSRASATFISNRAAIAFLTLHLLLSWLAIGDAQPRLIPLEIALWIAGWFLLRNTLKSTAAAGPKTAPTVL